MRGCQEGIRINTLLPEVQGTECLAAARKQRQFAVYGILKHKEIVIHSCRVGLRPILALVNVPVLGSPQKGILADTLWNPGRKLSKAWQTTAHTPAIPFAFFVTPAVSQTAANGRRNSL